VVGKIKILGLDVAEYRTGWCLGLAGTIPTPRIFKARLAGERTEDAAARLACWLRDLFERDRPDLIVMEHFLPQGAQGGRTTDFVREGQVGLQYVVRAVAACYGIPVRSPYPVTVRIHFCGVASAAPSRPKGYKRTDKEAAADRKATKRMVLDRAIALHYLPPTCTDDDMADSAAIFDYGSSTFGNVAAAFALAPGGA